jgi:hypothetical protein
LVKINRTAGLLVLAALLAALLALVPPTATLWQRTLGDAGHGPIFAGIAVVFLAMQAATGGRHSRAAYMRAFAFAVALGIATEIAQIWMPNRSVSAMDVLHDAAGAMLGLVIVALVQSRLRKSRVEKSAGSVALLITLGVVAIAVLAWEPFNTARAYSQRSRAFPTLAPMGSVADAAFAGARNASVTRSPLPPQWRRPGDGDALKLSFEAGSTPAFEISEPASDWRGHRTLSIDITNPGSAPLVLTLRILDRSHNWEHVDRFNLPLVIAPATRRIVEVPLSDVEAAPASRRMDMAGIANLMLFSPQPVENREFHVSRIWLE